MIVENNNITEDVISLKKKVSYLTICCVVLIVGVIIIYIMNFTGKQFITSSVGSKEKKYSVFLPASRLWMNTGIKVKKGEKIRLRISGGVHSAVNRIVFHEIDYSRPKYPWTFFPKEKSADGGNNGRREKLIDSASNYRDLLICTIKENDLSKIERNPRYPQENLDVESFSPKENNWLESEFVYTPAEDGSICLIINDNYIDDFKSFALEEEKINSTIKDLLEIKKYYDKVSNEDIPFDEKRKLINDLNAIDLVRYDYRFKKVIPKNQEEYKKWENRTYYKLTKGKEGEGEKYYRFFFDDNLGGYLVNIILKKE